MKKMRFLIIISLIFSLTACAKFNKDDVNPYEGISPKQLYEEAQDALAKKKYTEAAKRFEAMETMYPFSEYAERSELYLIYAYYESEDYPSAAATAERFIHLYPRSQKVDYAYYMKALANFQQNRGLFAKVFPMDESWRDPGSQFTAYSDFATFVERFPNSKYKANAQQRMIYLRNMFAQRLLNTADYYFIRKMYVAAAERAAQVVKDYPQAPSARQALIILRDSNLALGLNRAAADAEMVYEATYRRRIG